MKSRKALLALEMLSFPLIPTNQGCKCVLLALGLDVYLKLNPICQSMFPTPILDCVSDL